MITREEMKNYWPNEFKKYINPLKNLEEVKANHPEEFESEKLKRIYNRVNYAIERNIALQKVFFPDGTVPKDTKIEIHYGSKFTSIDIPTLETEIKDSSIMNLIKHTSNYNFFLKNSSSPNSLSVFLHKINDKLAIKGINLTTKTSHDYIPLHTKLASYIGDYSSQNTQKYDIWCIPGGTGMDPTISNIPIDSNYMKFSIAQIAIDNYQNRRFETNIFSDVTFKKDDYENSFNQSETPILMSLNMIKKILERQNITFNYVPPTIKKTNFISLKTQTNYKKS